MSHPKPNIVPGVSVFVCLLFSIALHSSYLNSTFLSNSLPCSNGALWEYTLYAKGVSVRSDPAVISVQDCVFVFVCVFMWVGWCVSESIYKGISPGGVDASLQWRESIGGGGELVHSRCSKQPTSLKTLPRLALHCTVHYLFIYFGWGANACSVALDISDRKDQRATPQMKLSKWPDSWVPRRTSLARTFYYDRSETSQQEGKREGKKKHHLPDRRERKRDKTSAAVSSPSMME